MLFTGASDALAAVPGPQEWARFFGCLVHYDPADGRGVMYGSLFARGPEGWETVETKRFTVVRPAGQSSAEMLKDNAGKWAAVEGYYGRTQETGGVFEAYVVKPSTYQAEIQPWCGFGYTRFPNMVTKINVSRPGDFVLVAAAGREALGLPEDQALPPEEMKELARQIKTEAGRKKAYIDWRSKYWNDKWIITRDDAARKEMRSGQGGFQFYEGRLGWSNAYVERADVTEKELLNFLEVQPAGGGQTLKESPAAMYASVEAVRDRWGKIVETRASGPVFETTPEFLEALRAGEAGPGETWKLSLSDERAEELDGKTAWLSGAKVLVRDQKGNIVDSYFAVESSIANEGLRNFLALFKELL